MDKNLIAPIQMYCFIRITVKLAKNGPSHVRSLSEGSKQQLVNGETSRKGVPGVARRENTFRDNDSIRSQPQLRAGGEGPSSGASCRSEGTVNKAHRLVLQPAVVCLRPPRMKKS